ncbi:hypothetical protein BU26DRAFT_571131 [Trematosphaeria pertusa]|uniref:Uncharacterized protein n=1 Tax=Trematosphaeria pertusa TaxID=390896 RepID=A0A6A6HYN0_9PLEO|nr:uncharacterized protein BU26DRAFT_571131 [Trematosphaeria pertusa]KAF2242460.1 hypothetical protein BU26DRAFT_571131 [Trematosphaeria pertusa]
MGYPQNRGVPQQYMGVPYQYTGVPQQQVNVHQHYMGGPQQYMGAAQHHTGVPQQYMGVRQKHMGGAQQHAGGTQQHMGVPQPAMLYPVPHPPPAGTTESILREAWRVEGFATVNPMDYLTVDGITKVMDAKVDLRNTLHRPTTSIYRPEELPLLSRYRSFVAANALGLLVQELDHQLTWLRARAEDLMKTEVSLRKDIPRGWKDFARSRTQPKRDRVVKAPRKARTEAEKSGSDKASVIALASPGYPDSGYTSSGYKASEASTALDVSPGIPQSPWDTEQGDFTGVDTASGSGTSAQMGSRSIQEGPACIMQQTLGPDVDAEVDAVDWDLWVDFEAGEKSR